jgi:hypothetical protein
MNVRVEGALESYTYEKLIEKYNAQRAERFAYIDFLIRFLGGLNRVDLLDFFGIGDAAASKEISEYKKLRLDNVDYDRVQRRNVILRSSFKPLIDLKAETALEMLANGFNKNRLYDRPMLPYQRVGAIPHSLDIELVSSVTRALYSNTAIKCDYISGSSSNHKERILLPTAIFYDGLTWMFRAFHRESPTGEGSFKCFDFSRLRNVTECPTDVAGLSETLVKDADWHLIVPLQLTLHPSLNADKKAALIQDFKLDEDELFIEEKAVLIYYLKKHWCIDVGDEPSQNGSYNFHLKNGASLKHLGCLKKLFEA